MHFRKRRLAAAEQGYSVAAQALLGADCILCAAEGPGPCLVFPAPEFTASVLAAGPGGCMGFAPLPGREDALLMITEFYPIFESEKAGVHLYRVSDGFAEPWLGRRVIDLPFVHRIATVDIDGTGYLVAATVCGGKDYRDDWSKPGKVYVSRIPDDLDMTWEVEPVHAEIHKNHGMNLGVYDRRQAVFISGSEGVFALFVPEEPGGPWEYDRLIEHEVSEVFPFDLDGDGVDELAVIEPFHGDAMGIYKQLNGGWERIFAASLGFGHGMWAGSLAGESVVIVGNREGSKNLCCYRVASVSPFTMEEIVVDAGSGTTNLTVVDDGVRQSVIASNPEHHEYARYDVFAD